MPNLMEIFFIILLFFTSPGMALTPEEYYRRPPEIRRTIGIDMGIKYSSVGVHYSTGLYEHNDFNIIRNNLGNRIIPSCVAFTDTDVLVGEAAKNQLDVNPERTICEVKRLVGRQFDDPEVQRYMRVLPYKIIDKDGKAHIEVKINGQVTIFSPEQIVAKLYVGLKEMAEESIGGKIDSAIVAVPAFFNNKQTKAIRDACSIARLDVRKILQEPVATVISAYGVHNVDKRNVLVLNLDSSRVEVSVLTKQDFVTKIEAIDIAATRSDETEDLEYGVMDYFIKLIERKYNKDTRLDKAALGKLIRECERVVRALDKQPEVLVKIKSLFDGIDIAKPFTKDMLDELNVDLFKKIKVLVLKVLKDTGLRSFYIHHVMVVGAGDTRIPHVHGVLRRFFTKERMQDIDPDGAVVRGAAIQGWVFNNWLYNHKCPHWVLNPAKRGDCPPLRETSMSVGIETVGGLVTTVIPRDTLVPAWKSKTFSMYQDEQTVATIKIFEGERPLSKDCPEIGRFNLTDIPVRRGVSQIEVQFRIDTVNRLHVTAIDSRTRKQQSYTIPKRLNSYSYKDTWRMEEEAEKFAEEDKMVRNRYTALRKLETYFNITNSAYNTGELTEMIETEDEDNLVKAFTEITEWLHELRQKVNDWENMLSPVMKKIFDSSGLRSSALLHDEM